MGTDSDSILIWDRPGSASRFKGLVVYWRGRVIDDQNYSCSIQEYLEQNKTEVRSLYLDTLIGIASSDFRSEQTRQFFEMSNIFESSNILGSPGYNQILYCLGLQHLIKNKKLKSIRIVTEDHKLGDCIRSIVGSAFLIETENSCLEFLRRMTFRSLQKKIELFKSILWIFYHFLRTRKYAVGHKSESSNEVLFFSYVVTSDMEDSIRRYWGDIFKKMENDWNISASLCAIFAVNKKSKGKKVKKNDWAYILENNFSFLALLKMTTKFFKKRSRNAQRYNDLRERLIREPWYPFIEDEVDSLFQGLQFMKIIYFEEMIGRVLAMFPNVKSIFYICENQPWEHILVRQARYLHGSSCRVVAVQHSTVRFWDLRYHMLAAAMSTGKFTTMPDFIAVNSNSARQSLQQSGCAPEKLLHVEALRYQSSPKKKASSGIEMSSGPLMVLVIGDIQDTLTIGLVKAIEAQVLNFINAKFVIKNHPLCSEFDLPAWLEEEKDSILESERAFDVCVSVANSSGMMDALLRGIPVLSVVKGDSLDYSPIEDGSMKRSIIERMNLLDGIRHLVSQKKLGSQIDFFEGSALKRWKKLIERGNGDD